MKLTVPIAAELFAARCAKIALSPRGVLALWSAVLITLFVFRAFLFTGTDADDGEQLIYMQSWALGYGARNPPVFTWLVMAVQPFLGVSVAAVVFVKFALLGGCFWLLYRSGLIVLGERPLAALAALSPIALYYVSWDAAFHYTHSVILAFAICLTFHRLLILDLRRNLRAYMAFGVAVAFGLLSKYNYLLFLGALLIAVLWEPGRRRILLDRRMLLAGAIALILAGPHYHWLWRHRFWLSAIAEDRFNPEGPAGSPLNLAGILETFGAAFDFLLPLALLFLLFFPRAWGRAGSSDGPAAAYRRLLQVLMVAILALTIVGVVASGAVRIRNHYMFLLILFPLLALARVQAAGAGVRALNAFAATLVALAAVVPAAAAVKYLIDPLRSSKAYYHVPYAALAERIKAAGFTGGTIVGDWFGYPLAGNFRPYFPNARILNLLDWQIAVPPGEMLSLLVPPPRPDAKGQCLIVWTPSGDGSRKQAVLHKADLLLGVRLPPDTPSETLTAAFHNGGGRTLTIAYIFIPEGRGNCR